MPYNTKSILRDAGADPAPQRFDPVADDYVPYETTLLIEEQVMTTQVIAPSGTESIIEDVTNYNAFTISLRANAPHYLQVDVTWLNAAGAVVSAAENIILETGQYITSEPISVRAPQAFISVTNLDGSAKTYDVWLNGLRGQ